MIEKLRVDATIGEVFSSDQREKINELIEASNRQDRVLAQLIHNGKGGLEQYLNPDDYAKTMKAYQEDWDG